MNSSNPTSMNAKRVQIEAQKLAQFCAAGAAQTKSEDLARLAITQAYFSQAAIDALIVLLKQHNIVSADQLDRVLADQYKRQREMLVNAPRVQPATMMPV